MRCGPAFQAIVGIQAVSTFSRVVGVRKSIAFISTPLNRVHEGKTSSLTRVAATLEKKETESGNIEDTQKILSAIKNARAESKSWAEDFGLTEESGAAFYALFSGLRSAGSMGIKGKPFFIKKSDMLSALELTDEKEGFAGFFTFDDMAKAVEDDFLDAIRGSTDNRKGWHVTSVSEPKGSSFEDARMTIGEINAALEKGTVIFNTAGSHIPKLAGPTLACCDASSLPCAVNLYVTAAGKRTSAPPHTDKQDVMVVQTAGSKRWRVYTPPNPSLKKSADMFARGKGADSLSLYSLEDGAFGCEKLLDVTLNSGDVLFIPAAFPHTTDTINDLPKDETDSASLHLTFNFDTHVWDLNYLSARRYALRRAGITDSAMGQEARDDNQYVGNVNALPGDIRNDMFMNFPLDFLDENNDDVVNLVAEELKRISMAVDVGTFQSAPESIWKETVERIKIQGMELLDIHRDMYLAAMDEGNERKNEEAMTAHLTGDALRSARAMTPEKMERLSLFRVQKFNEKISLSKQSLIDWSFENSLTSQPSEAPLPDDWAFTMPLKVGDEVEADLGGAFFAATVTKISGSSFDVKFFDGDVMNGLSRDMIQLLAPPEISTSELEDGEKPPEGLTKKELKKWLKKKEKKKNKNRR